MKYIKNSVIAFAALLITFVFPTSTRAQKDVKVVNAPSEPVPVTGTINVGNTVPVRPTLPPGAFSLSLLGGTSRASGPDPEGTNYAISSLTVANVGSIPVVFSLIGKWGTTSDCVEFSGQTFEVGGPIVKVPAGETVHLSFPQPFVMSAQPGEAACLSARVLEGIPIFAVVGFRF